jgi:SMI1 / KNR4 family (SUKH-1)
MNSKLQSYNWKEGLKMPKITDRIARIKGKIIGANLHLNECLSIAEVNQFEQKYGIKLPEEFRVFLLEVGNGGDGPSTCGLGLLNETIPAQSAIPMRPDIPFPLDKVWIWENEEKDWWNDPSELVQRVHCHGQLLVGNEGDGEYWSLIVAGDQYGYIWNVSDVGAGPCDPPKQFLDWYESWLDTAKIK